MNRRSPYGSGKLFRFFAKHTANDHIHLHVENAPPVSVSPPSVLLGWKIRDKMEPQSHHGCDLLKAYFQ